MQKTPQTETFNSRRLCYFHNEITTPETVWLPVLLSVYDVSLLCSIKWWPGSTVYFKKIKIFACGSWMNGEVMMSQKLISFHISRSYLYICVEITGSNWTPTKLSVNCRLINVDQQRMCYVAETSSWPHVWTGARLHSRFTRSYQAKHVHRWHLLTRSTSVIFILRRHRGRTQAATNAKARETRVLVPRAKFCWLVSDCFWDTVQWLSTYKRFWVTLLK